MIILKKYNKKAQFCFTDTNIFMIHIKTEDFYKDIAKDVKKCFIHQITKIMKDPYQ